LCVSFLLGAVYGCAGPPPSFDDIETGRTERGTLDVGVLGASGDVQFYVDGDRVDTADGWSWWYDARMVRELPAGLHTVEARFRVGRFEGHALWSRVVTREPVVIEPGRRTRLTADVRGASTDPPEERLFVFAVDAPRPSAAEALDIEGQPSTSLVPVDVRLAWLDPQLAQELAVGDEPNIPLVSPPPGGPLAPEAITIHGDRVLSGGRRPAPGKPRSAEASDAGVRVDRSSGVVEIFVLVESQPSGADVSLDDAYVGRTPIRVRIDPRTDHLLQVERPGCEPRVQLLSTADWKTGRSPRILQKLDCQ